MMNFSRFFKLCMLAGILLFSACATDKIEFPAQSQGEEVTVTTRPTAKPSDLVIFADFNRRFEWYWPETSDRVKSAKIAYMEDGERKELLITDFAAVTMIQVQKLEPYTFTVQYLTDDQTASKETKLTLLPRDYETLLTAASMQTEAIAGGVRFTFKAPQAKAFKYTISAPVNGRLVAQTFISATPENTFDFKGFDEVLEPVEFHVLIQDLLLDYSQLADFTRLEVPLPPNHILLEKSLMVEKFYNGVLVHWTNENQDPTKIRLSYSKDSAPFQTVVSPIITDQEGSYFYELPVGNFNIKASAEVLDIYTTKEVLGTAAIPAATEFKTAAQKAGWTPFVSSSQTAADNLAHLLYDDAASFWYSANNISFPQTVNTSFTKTRATSANGLYTQTELLNPAAEYDPILVKEITVWQRANVSTAIKDIKIYGTNLQNQTVFFRDFTFADNAYTANGAKTVININNVNNIPLKALKIEIHSGWTSANRFTAMSDISILGFKK